MTDTNAKDANDRPRTKHGWPCNRYGAQASPRRWRDGDTMLSFGAFTLVVLALMALQIADASNWIAVSDTVADLPACQETQP